MADGRGGAVAVHARAGDLCAVPADGIPYRAAVGAGLGDRDGRRRHAAHRHGGGQSRAAHGTPGCARRVGKNRSRRIAVACVRALRARPLVPEGAGRMTCSCLLCRNTSFRFGACDRSGAIARALYRSVNPTRRLCPNSAHGCSEVASWASGSGKAAPAWQSFKRAAAIEAGSATPPLAPCLATAVALPSRRGARAARCERPHASSRCHRGRSHQVCHQTLWRTDVRGRASVAHRALDALSQARFARARCPHTARRNACMVVG